MKRRIVLLGAIILSTSTAASANPGAHPQWYENLEFRLSVMVNNLGFCAAQYRPGVCLYGSV
jgi:hypothetical protein